MRSDRGPRQASNVGIGGPPIDTAFTGAAPEAFLDPDIPEDHKIVLKQSHRVPRAVHGLAEDLIRRVARRQAKEYLPRPDDGLLVRFSRGGYKSAEFAILNTASEHLERGKTVMFLTSCGYMLRPIIAVLRKHGIPFHNPYRKSNGFWNPLRHGSRGSTVSRILSLLIGHPDYGAEHRPWTHGDLAAWDKGYRELLEWWRARVTADVDLRERVVLEWLQEEASSWHMMSDLRGVMSGIITKAIEWEILPETFANPIHRVKLPKKREVREKRILNEEQSALVLARRYRRAEDRQKQAHAGTGRPRQPLPGLDRQAPP